MIYIISGISIALCIAVIIFGLRIFKENRKLAPKKSDFEDDDEIRF
jgi:hypothetical protein